jgi:ring-1,2-phenylacetyl-CoA epoxidase subunit PaaB
MQVFDVLSRRKEGDDWTPAGSVNAPDLDMAMLLARETHFRHGEGETYALRRRGESEVHVCPDPTGIGGVIDRSYRRQTGYVGVGAKLKEVHALLAQRGMVIEGARPGRRRQEAGHGA